MDYFANVRDAWNVVRRERALQGLAGIEAVHAAALYALITVAIVPFMAVVGILSTAETGDVLPALIDELTAVGAMDYLGLVIPILVIALASYVLVAVFSVAAQGGIVDQVYASLQGSHVSFSAGLRTGFRYWWRSGAILAIPAMPSLVYALVMTLVMQGMVITPLSAGERIDPVALQMTLALLSPLSSLISLVALPLGVWATISLRFGIVRERPWREALSQGWRFLRSHLKHVALQFLAILVIGFAVTIVAEIILGVFATVAVLLALWAGTAIGTGAGIAVGVVGGLVAFAGLAAIVAAVEVLGSTAWTVMWSRLADADPMPADLPSPAENPLDVTPVPPAAPAGAPAGVPPAFPNPSHVSQEVQ